MENPMKFVSQPKMLNKDAETPQSMVHPANITEAAKSHKHGVVRDMIGHHNSFTIPHIVPDTKRREQ